MKTTSNRSIIRIEKLNIRIKGEIDCSPNDLTEFIMKEVVSTLLNQEQIQREKRNVSLDNISLNLSRVRRDTGTAEISRLVGYQLRNSLKERIPKKKTGGLRG